MAADANLHPAANAIIGLYQRQGRAWDAERSGGFNDRIWIDRFAAFVPRGGFVLDLGCGGGRPIAEHLASQGLRVTGIDSSEPLVALARDRLPEHVIIIADMRGLDLGRRFHGILAWDSLFHLPAGDQRTMFPVFARHAMPGAVLMFSSGPEAGEALGELGGEPLYHASLAPEEYRVLLSINGFDVIDHVASDPRCGGRTVWLAEARP